MHIQQDLERIAGANSRDIVGPGNQRGLKLSRFYFVGVLGLLKISKASIKRLLQAHSQVGTVGWAPIASQYSIFDIHH